MYTTLTLADSGPLSAIGGQQRLQAVRKKLASGDQALQLHFPGADLGYIYGRVAAAATTISGSASGISGDPADESVCSSSLSSAAAEKYTPSIVPGARLPYFEVVEEPAIVSGVSDSDTGDCALSRCSLDAVARSQQGGPTLTLFLPTMTDSCRSGAVSGRSSHGRHSCSPAWVEGASRINQAQALALPITVVHVEDAVWDVLPSAPSPSLSATEDFGRPPPPKVLQALLVRPDGHIAGSWTADGDSGIDDHCARNLCAQEAEAELWRVGCHMGCMQPHAIN